VEITTRGARIATVSTVGSSRQQNQKAEAMSKNEYEKLFQTSRFIVGRVAIVPVKMWLSLPIAVAMAQEQIPPPVHVHSAKVPHHAQWKGDSQNTLNAFGFCREALLKNEIARSTDCTISSWQAVEKVRNRHPAPTH